MFGHHGTAPPTASLENDNKISLGEANKSKDEDSSFYSAPQISQIEQKGDHSK
jgi:hypothetical protein